MTDESQRTPVRRRLPSLKGDAAATALVVAVILLQVVLVRAEGQPWWCECGRPFLVTADAWSNHTSQHLFDPYSLSHVLHGFLFCWLLAWLWPRASRRVLAVGAVAMEAGWELIENSPFVIERYRQTTASLGYAGDSVGNSLGDALSCLAGFWIASALGWRRTLAIYVAVELLLLVTIRDNLTLNVVMLLFPLDAVRAWQMGHS